DFLTTRAEALCDEHKTRAAENPMRVLDCKKKACRDATREAPRITDHLCEQCKAHFERVQEGLSSLDIDFILEPRLARGLDYYTRTTFEFVSSEMDAAQSTIGGGGRYDGLAESLGGPPTPGIGFGSGIERILIGADGEGVFPAPEERVDVFVVDTTGGGHARDITAALRRAGTRADRAFDGRSWKAQMKAADKSGAARIVFIEDDDVTADRARIRDAATREERTVPRSTLIEELK
ncbi:MAG TPA: ATP phosphoribosyltransferase regulatory subunit, partial [Acidimicrobiales bacterium]|nr:ATP phosphoribosyltransferase regulatory subunit [Acidimicrobiales bacterium]